MEEESGVCDTDLSDVFYVDGDSSSDGGWQSDKDFVRARGTMIRTRHKKPFHVDDDSQSEAGEKIRTVEGDPKGLYFTVLVDRNTDKAVLAVRDINKV